MPASKPTSSTTHRTYSFGEFTLDVDRGALQCAGEDIKLRPKSFEMLGYLVERHGRLVSKDELLAAIWGKTVVTDDAVTQCLIDIRRAIKDQSQKVIRTVPRRGYLFDIPVTEHGGPVTAPDIPRRGKFASSWSRWHSGAALVLFLGLVAVWWGFTDVEVGVPEAIESQPAFTSPSIAVLPFLDMSPLQDQEYLADGISEEVLNLLVQIPELRVIARTSSFSFKDQNADIAEIAERLNVTHVLEGSVRKSGDRIRITAQLVNASTSEHLWSETYDRTLDDVFAVQDDISANVIDRLRITLLAPIPKARETDPEAYRFYLRAVHLFKDSKRGELAEAESFFRKTLQLDPDFAPAWRELSRVYSREIGTGASLQEDIRRTRDTLDRALAIDPNDAASLAYSAWHIVDFDGDIVRAAQLFERAISIAPADENVLQTAFIFAITVGRLEDAITLGKYSVARNPLCQGCYLQLFGAYQLAGYLDEAEATIRTSQSLFGGGYWQLGRILLLKGQPQAALELFRDEPSDRARLIGTAMAMHDLGRSDESGAA